MNVLSLFSGIGGFDLGFEQAGMTFAAQVENNGDCQRVLEKHWPGKLKGNDVKKYHPQRTEFDAICGGFPCQDLSVAGHRAGLAGTRSGLWHEFRRIIAVALPRFVVIENVPGLLSSNEGEDFRIVIDGITQIGYAVDCQFLDTQEFGCAQRRNRIFIVCVRLAGLLKQRTPLSRRITADLLARHLLESWAVIRRASSVERSPLASASPTEQPESSLQKRMNLFAVAQELKASDKSQNVFTGLLVQFTGEPVALNSGLIEPSELLSQAGQARATSECLLRLATKDDGLLSTSTLLKSASEDACGLVNKSTTLTSIKPIMETETFIYAVAFLHTITLMLPYLDWSEDCWSVGQSVLTLLRELILYAKTSRDDLFGAKAMRVRWRDYLVATQALQDQFERSFGKRSCAEILFESESVRGDSPPSRKAGQNTSGTITESFGRGGPTIDRAETYVLDVCKTLQAEGDASPDAEGRGLQVITAPTLLSGDNKTGGTRPPGSTVDNCDGLIVTAFHGSQDTVTSNKVTSSCGRNNGLETCVAILNCTMVKQQMGVRRLTPRECERLQGFTDTDSYITIEACLDPQKPSANADETNLKSQRSVGNAERIASQSDVLFVENDFNRSCQNDSRLVPLLAHISCVDERVQFRNPKKSPLFASGAERQNWFLPPTVPADFAPYVAHLCQSVDRAMLVGSEELLLSEQCSIHRRSGRLHAKLFGSGIMQLVRDALSDSLTKEKPTKFITEKVFDSQNLGSSIQTLFLFVAHAMSGFIPKPTENESFRIDICSRSPWTSWGIEGGNRVLISDSARYRMLGNAVSVPVARWIGKRLMETKP